ncbi:MAG: hypothetical protein E6Q83_18525 [Thiothrix sp.]|nr:MAG: hypothetical protein E6Q83_18525 [Thiothrix sp.]
MKILSTAISSYFRKALKISVYLLSLGLAATSTSVYASTFKVIDGEYKLPATVDKLVTPKVKTELWAHVWRPQSRGRYPLVVFLHGNHATCGKIIPELEIREDDNIDYTTTGTCPEGYVVTPNHMGYTYLATNLAKQGFVVVSINANRGINAADGEMKDWGLNLRRGRLVLRHLQKLAQWNSQGGAPASLGFELKGLMDFSQVGLMGHSRGGEGMRAAVTLYNDPGSAWPELIKGLKVRSLFEIGPVDGQAGRTLNANGLVWNVLLPACDGDVSDLQGVKPFDRMLQDTSETQALTKSTFQVFGANHNFYNTEWQISDSTGCRGQTPLFNILKGSISQRRTALYSLIPFFRSNLGKHPIPALAKRFDPSQPLPPALLNETFYARGYNASSNPAENFIIDNFDRETGISSQGRANESFGLSLYEHKNFELVHDITQRTAAINWDQAGAYLQINAASLKGIDASNYQTLEFRVALLCFDELCNSKTKPTGDVDFSISLTGANTALSEPVALTSYAAVHRAGSSWFGSPAGNTNNVILQTVRIPLAAFNNIDLAHFSGVRFSFDRSAKSSIYLANIRLTKAAAGDNPKLTDGEAVMAADGLNSFKALRPTQVDENKVIAIRHVNLNDAEAQATSAVEIELASNRAFPVGGALPILTIGNKSFKLSRYPNGDLHRLVFTLEEAEYAATQQGDELTVHIGGAEPWKLGNLDKSVSN